MRDPLPVLTGRSRKSSSQPRFILGVDLGQANDYTAIIALQQTPPTGEQDGHRYAVRLIERLPKMTPYPEQVERVAHICDRLRKNRSTHLVVDQTGVGRPVVDMLRAAGADLSAAVTITGGDSVTWDGLEVRVPKRDLVSVVQVLLQSGRLQIVLSLPAAGILVEELLGFKVSISLRGHDRYGNDVGDWRDAEHDDLVLALALAAWYGEQIPSGVQRVLKQQSPRSRSYGRRSSRRGD